MITGDAHLETPHAQKRLAVSHVPKTVFNKLFEPIKKPRRKEAAKKMTDVISFTSTATPVETPLRSGTPKIPTPPVTTLTMPLDL